jgi:methylated-DNA-[protein]-cysteine S-methyltransferase
VLSSIIEYLPLNSEFSETKPDRYAFSILQAMSQICEGKMVKYNFILALENLPQFTRRVLNLTTKIPKGFVATYGGLAKAVGNPQGARAVGNIQARNPFAPIVPCHRVISSTLDLGGYGGGLDLKRRLLEREGVIFEGKRVSRKCHWVPEE